MLQLINKKKFYFYILIFVLLTSIFNINFIKNINNIFLINDISIQTSHSKINQELYSKIKFLLKENILLINKNKLLNETKEFNFLENLEIKKKYPSTLIIKAKLTSLLAQTYVKQERYFIGNNRELILAKSFKNKKKLPTIFGNFEINDYFELNSNLVEQKINIDQIERYYFHKNRRWDLYFTDGILMMLPGNNINEALKIFNNFKININIKPGSIVDLRIPGRIVIK
tara:strand:+ start:1123 stop:1806 length:684 start_codon:yes stop_codon:yes gene_type:complete